ncbi:efflux RND transporter permease subunit [Actimicrobium sp. CCC2.4]|uniref:efflux RND transporter permease subunit n=1 Tax=Actimicrobium sp. CCC2.4 TaxID=3048606 RepID=UPI002AC9EA91|nr:efflux RND transporter permease subunit [Actimicrobium sp. CCC2.4]MEB0135068.1 efflux RND transporter permease subunit [Actimicrobium sp. CCC2.4]WPX31885.1 efflux RND transporter permease subunit [Actimicrobium sp. CCC2.4]
MNDDRANDLPALSIRRPWLIIVINLLIVIAGIGALLGVEVRELPNIDRPIVAVRADYPGAAPETLDAEVTRLIEGAASRVPGVYLVRSASEEGNLRVIIEFNPDVDLVTAANDVRDAVARVERDLPEGVENLTIVKADADAEPVLQLAVSSQSLAIDALSRVVEEQIEPALIAVEGVADIALFGSRERVMLVRIDPLRLAAHQLAVSDLATLLRTAPFDVPAGSLESPNQQVLVRANASVTSPEALRALQLRPGLALGEVADISYSPAKATSYVRLNGRTVISLGIVRQAQSNTVAISKGVRAVVDRLNRDGADLQITVVSDDATFISGAIAEVLGSLALAVLIVVAVVGIFLGQWRATLVPVVAIPVALIGTLAAIWLLGYSVNLLTLLALLLATGMVVDDAIVVLENIQRRRSQGLGPRAAAVLGTREVFFAVVATTATLVSVFVPISFLPSAAGRLFAEFGFVMAIAVAISSFVALTLGPMIASRLPEEKPPGPLWRKLSHWGERAANAYARCLAIALRRAWWVVAACGLLAGAAVWSYTQLNSELTPTEDRGLLSIRMEGPSGVGLGYIDRQLEQALAIVTPLQDEGLVQNIFTITGRYDLNRAEIVAPLTDWSKRSVSQAQLTARLQRELDQLPGVRVRIRSGNSLGVGGGDGSVQMGVTGDDYARIADAAYGFAQAIERDLPGLRDVRVEYTVAQPQLTLKIDRQRATELGVSIEGLDLMLRALVSGTEIAELTVDDRNLLVMLDSNAYRATDPQDLLAYSVRAGGAGGERLVPLSQFVKLEETAIASELERLGQRRAVQLSAVAIDGMPLQRAVNDLRALAAKELPSGMGLLFRGDAATLEQTGRDVAITFAIALLVVFLVLVAQFEGITSAAVVIITVPFGLAAAVFAMTLSGTSLNIYSQIGLLLLVGVMAKNSILMVEFADQLRDAGRSVLEAAQEAAVTRLRPIMMTMASTVLGALPLVLGSGPGAESRASIGWVIFGGLSLASLFTLFLTPVIYLGLARFAKPRASQGALLAAEMKLATAQEGDSA